MPIKDHRILEETLSIECSNPNILFSYDAETYDGAALFAHRKIREYLKNGLMALVPFDIKPFYKKRHNLYFVTKKGANLIGRPDDFRQKTTKAYHDIAHELMKYDINLSLRRNFPDYDFKTEYEKRFKSGFIDKNNNKEGHIEADIYVTATEKTGNRIYNFIIETEHKPLTRTYKEKVLTYDKAIENGFFKRNGLPDHTKILFVCCNREFPTFTRPQEYDYKDNKPKLDLLYSQFDKLMTQVAGHSNKHYRFLPFPEFAQIAGPVWRMPNGIKVKLIGN